MFCPSCSCLLAADDSDKDQDVRCGSTSRELVVCLEFRIVFDVMMHKRLFCASSADGIVPCQLLPPKHLWFCLLCLDHPGRKVLSSLADPVGHDLAQYA